MKRKKLLATLAGWLDNDGQKQRDHREELEELLEKLMKKKVALEENIQREKGERKLKQLQKELDIVRVQHKKGMQVLQGLKES